jgi:molybdenum cofactor biosynthesis enzyme MoaA
MLMNINLFDHKVPVRTRPCTLNGSQRKAKDLPYVNVYIRMTDRCDANCPFCAFHSNLFKEKFDLYKLYYCLNNIKEHVYVNKIAFTGGEPTYYMSEFLDALTTVRELFPTTHVTVNTNGVNLLRLMEAETLGMINCVSLSRHHQSDEINTALFRISSPPSENKIIEEFPDKLKLHLRCNLISGKVNGVCGPAEVKKYIDFYDEFGVMDFGFVSLMKVNKFCQDLYVDPLTPGQLKKYPDFRLSATRKRGKTCSCYNYLVKADSGNLVRVYSRADNDVENCDSMLVYDVNKLRVGFKGEVLK